MSSFIVNAIMMDLKFNPFYFDIYAEPFCGICSIFQKFKITSGKSDFFSVLGDSNMSLILLLNEIKTNGSPKLDINYNTWLQYKNDPLDSYQKCIYQYGCSFNNFSSYVYDNGSCYRTLKKLEPILRSNTMIINSDYRKFFDYLRTLSGNILCYCDPPYDCDTNKMNYGKSFDQLEFYNEVRLLPKNIRVYISNTWAPDDFKCVWSMVRRCKINTSLDPNIAQKTITERLFTL